MAETKDQTLTGSIDLDGNIYSNCEFKDAVVTYSGGEPPEFHSCTFHTVQFSFAGPAGNTLAFLRMMAPASTGMRNIALGLAPEFKT